MRRKMWLLLVISLFVLSVSGCMVKESTYIKKVDEADDLGKNLAACEQKSNEQAAQIEIMRKEKDDLVKLLQEEKTKTVQVVAAKEETSKTYSNMIEKMKSEIAEGQVTITELKGKLTVNMVDAILFDSGKADIKPEGRQILQKVADVIGQVEDKAIRVEGHTDNVKISSALTRAFPSNWELSAARATNVARYLQRMGVDPNLLSAAAYGEYRPVSENDTPEGRAMNRRIEIVLVPKD
ncbi:MAG TPA: OmpA family protein [Syntrophales bacterium]